MIGPKDSIDKLLKNLQKVEALPMKLFDNDEDEVDGSFDEKSRKRHSTSSSTSTFSGKNQKTKGKSGQPEDENPPEAKKAPQTQSGSPAKTPQQARKDKWLEDRKKQFGMKSN